MPEKQEMGVGMGAVSASKSKYELEDWGGGVPTPSRLWKAEGRGQGPSSPIFHNKRKA